MNIYDDYVRHVRTEHSEEDRHFIEEKFDAGIRIFEPSTMKVFKGTSKDAIEMACNLEKKNLRFRAYRGVQIGHDHVNIFS